MGLALGIVASAIFGLCYWILKSIKRTRFLLRFGWIPALVAAVWIAVFFLAPQQYTLRIWNVSGEDVTDIDVHLAGLVFAISELKEGASIDMTGWKSLQNRR